MLFDPSQQSSMILSKKKKQLHDKTFNELAPERFFIELAFDSSNKKSYSDALPLNHAIKARLRLKHIHRRCRSVGAASQHCSHRPPVRASEDESGDTYRSRVGSARVAMGWSIVRLQRTGRPTGPPPTDRGRRSVGRGRAGPHG